TWPDYKHDGCSIKTNMLLKSYFKKDMIIHYWRRYTKSLHANLEKIDISIHIDAREIKRFWNEEGKQPTKLKLQREKNKVYIKREQLYRKNLVQEVDQDTWIVSCFNTDTDIQYVATKLDNDGSNKENSKSKTSDLFDK
ncbi:17081_t:CDS:2, partial [Cetraspora pellucida]